MLYESGPRLGDTLAALARRLGDRDAAVAREISKLHEECVTGTLAELAERYADAPPKGEIVIVVGTAAGAAAGQRRRARRGARRCARAACRRRAPRPKSPSSSKCPRKRAYARALERSQVNRQEAEKRGRGAETLACWYLRLHGWRILARRARVPGGEVDIVARRGRTLAFVEVKARATEEAAAFALDD